MIAASCAVGIFGALLGAGAVVLGYGRRESRMETQIAMLAGEVALLRTDVRALLDRTARLEARKEDR